ncbi:MULTISPECIES: DUF1127 domain-containing protein [unclassified Mesorhizobium]|uniref:DUF1127 domain-containing protein n=1 Tax=unclassified Mesorhizobium TaxID=325217 RepID=UPI00301537F1
MFAITLLLSPDNRDMSLIERVRIAYDAFRANRSQRRTVRDLSKLDDYMLKDIGITRSEIMSIAYDSSTERMRGHDNRTA